MRSHAGLTNAHTDNFLWKFSEKNDNICFNMIELGAQSRVAFFSGILTRSHSCNAMRFFVQSSNPHTIRNTFPGTQIYV